MLSSLVAHGPLHQEGHSKEEVQGHLLHSVSGAESIPGLASPPPMWKAAPLEG